MTMNEKHREVRSWLECKFAGETIPAYEINSETVDQLYDLMRRNKERDKDVELVIQDMRQAATEYVAEAQRERKILEQLCLSPEVLSQSGVTSLRTLVSVANSLKIRDTTDTKYLLAIGELSEEKFQVSEAKRMEQKSARQLEEKANAARIKSKELKQALLTLNEEADKQAHTVGARAKETRFLQKKGREYNAEIQKAKDKLNKLGMHPSLFHRQLLKKAEEIQALEDKLQPMKTKLKTYHSLPPDLSKAKVKIEELQQDLDVLEAQINQKMNVMHL